MKKVVLMIKKVFFAKYMVILLLLMGIVSCDNKFVEGENDEDDVKGLEVIEGIEPVNEEDFFYYFEEKISFKRVKIHQIILQSVPNIHWMDFAPRFSDDFIVSVALWTESTPFYLLTAKDERPIPLATIESFKAMPEIVSVSHWYQYRNGTYLVILGAPSDEFTVKLKKTTSTAQLQALATQNGCTIGDEDPFVKDHIKLYVSKTTGLNTIQMSKLFYDTGLFEFSSPYFRIFSGHDIPPQVPTPFFYYYYGIKMYLQQVTDKIYLQFVSDTQKEQMLDIIGSEPSLQIMSYAKYNWEQTFQYSKGVVLETKDEKPIPSTIIDFFKAKPETVAVTYLYKRSQETESLLYVADVFWVKLDYDTTYEQLQELATQNDCIIGEENQFTKKQFTMYVSKNSNLDALQMSCLFYETGLFEYCEAGFGGFGSILPH